MADESTEERLRKEEAKGNGQAVDMTVKGKNK